jgi:hypothetical protein
MLEAYLGTWFDAYHGDFGHIIWRIFLNILAYVFCGIINFDDDDISVLVTTTMKS